MILICFDQSLVRVSGLQTGFKSPVPSSQHPFLQILYLPMPLSNRRYILEHSLSSFVLFFLVMTATLYFLDFGKSNLIRKLNIIQIISFMHIFWYMYSLKHRWQSSLILLQLRHSETLYALHALKIFLVYGVIFYYVFTKLLFLVLLCIYAIDTSFHDCDPEIF